MSNHTLSRRCLAVIGLLLLLLGTACGRTEQLNEQKIAELQEIGKLTLIGAARSAVGGYGPEYLYDTEWYPDDDICRIGEDRFPEWADNETQICVYWEGTYSTKHINQRRTRENPAVYYYRYGTAWGWALVGQDYTHVLELGYGYHPEDDEDGEGIRIVIDAWDQPEAED